MYINKKRFLKATLMASVAVAIVLSGCSGKDDELAYLESARSHTEGKQYQKAVIELKNALQINPDNGDARLQLAKVYLKVRDGASAEKELIRAKQLGIQEKDLYLIKGEALLQQRLYDRILDEIKEEGIQAADLSEVQILRAQAFAGNNKKEKALDLYHAVLAREGTYAKAYSGIGRIYLVEKDYEKSIEASDEALQVEKNNVDAWTIKGLAYFKLQKFPLAEESFESALAGLEQEIFSQRKFVLRISLIQTLLAQKKIDKASANIEIIRKIIPENPFVSYLSALRYFMAGKYDLAEIDLHHVIKVMPGHVPTHLLLGSVHFARRNYEQANDFLTRYVNEVPTHIQARKLLGETRLRLNRPGDAVEILAPIVNDDTKDVELLTMIGNAASQSGQDALGTHYLRKAASVRPESTGIREELAKAYLRKGAIDQAIEELEGLSDTNSSDSNRLLLIYAYLRKQEFSQAVKLTDELLSANPESPMLMTLKGGIQTMSGERANARTLFRNALKIKKDYLPALFALSKLDLEDGKLTESDDRLNQILALDPNNVNAMLGLSQISERRQNRKQALSWIEQARKANASALVPRFVLARYYLKTGKTDEALEVLKEVEAIKPTDVTFLLLMGNAELQIGRFNKAIDYFERYVRQQPQSVAGYIALATAESKHGRLSSAKRTLKKALEISPNHLRATILFISIETREKNYPEAERLAMMVKENKKTEQWGYVLLSDVYVQSRNYAKAQVLLNVGLAKYQSFTLSDKLSKAYYLDGKKDKSVEVMAKWVKNNPDDLKGTLALASTYQKMDRIDEAVKLYQSVLDNNSGNVIALNNMALILFENNQELAISYAERAYKKARTSTAIADTYGWMLVQSGDMERGSEILSRVAVSSDDPNVLYHYAVTLHRKGLKEQAKRALAHAFESDREFEDMEGVMALRKELNKR